jgi:hypothetical protein
MSGYPMQDPSQTQQQPQVGNAPLQSAQAGPNPSEQDPSQLIGQLRQVAQTPLQPVPQAGPDQGSPVRRFLTNSFWGAGQAALEHVGLPRKGQQMSPDVFSKDKFLRWR